jgi:hypothetical protein
MRKGLAGSRIAVSVVDGRRRRPASFSAMCDRCLGILLLLALSTFCPAQQQGQPVVASSVLFPQIVPAFDPITSATVSLVGNPGPARYCYWIVTNYLVGNTSPVKVRPCITNGPITLSSSNYDQVSFNFPPGAVSADVLRTSGTGMDQAPQGSCNCAVATGNTSGTVLDQSNSLNSYTVTSFDPSVLPISLTNEVVGAGQSHLKLRQNGLLIGDISALANGLADPGASGIVFRTTPNTTRIVVLGDVTALGSTGTGNFALANAPTIANPALTGTPTLNGNNFATIAERSTADVVNGTETPVTLITVPLLANANYAFSCRFNWVTANTSTSVIPSFLWPASDFWDLSYSNAYDAGVPASIAAAGATGTGTSADGWAAGVTAFNTTELNPFVISGTLQNTTAGNAVLQFRNNTGAANVTVKQGASCIFTQTAN